MHLRAVQQILGLLLMLFSLTMLPPVFVSAWYQDGSAPAFVSGFLVTLLIGLAIWVPVRRADRELRTRDGFLVVAGFWTLLGAFSAAPLLFAAEPRMSFTDAVFEAVSGLTTTGSTVLTGLDSLPPAVLYYRAQLQFLGGGGIIVLAVAVLPMLGVGGSQLLRAETPGPVKDTRLTPRIAETARALWLIYLGLNLACAVAYWLAGMTPFDAICHAMTTIATGGYSTHDASFAYFDSRLLDAIAIVFMFMGGVNFALHFIVWRSLRPGYYLQDAEFPVFGLIILAVAGLCTAVLLASHSFDAPVEAMIQSLFNVVSVITTTGYTTSDFSVWPGALPVVMVFIMFVGGCAGSTSGGLKVIRVLLLYKQGIREVLRLIHPAGQIPVKVADRAIPQRVIDGVWGFFAVYVVLFAVMMLLTVASGVDQVTAFSAVATTLNNVGPGLGEVAVTFKTVNDLAKWVGILGMLLGRLEIFTLFVLISPAFWRR